MSVGTSIVVIVIVHLIIIIKKTGCKIFEAVKNGDSDILKVRLSNAIQSEDCRAADFKYHLLCYVKNIENKKRKSDFNSRNNDTSLRKRSAEIELLSEIEIKIMNGAVLSIADIEVTFKDI